MKHFRPSVISNDVLKYVADVTAKPPVDGDMRYALDLLLYSGNLAEQEGASRVTVEHIRRVIGSTYPSITDEDIFNLSDKAKLVLLGVVRALKGGRRPYASLREIRLSTGMVCEEMAIRSSQADELDDIIDDLYDRGIIDIKSLSFIGISGVLVDGLERLINGLIMRLRNGLGRGP